MQFHPQAEVKQRAILHSGSVVTQVHLISSKCATHRILMCLDFTCQWRGHVKGIFKRPLTQRYASSKVQVFFYFWPPKRWSKDSFETDLSVEPKQKELEQLFRMKIFGSKVWRSSKKCHMKDGTTDKIVHPGWFDHFNIKDHLYTKLFKDQQPSINQNMLNAVWMWFTMKTI